MTPAGLSCPIPVPRPAAATHRAGRPLARGLGLITVSVLLLTGVSVPALAVDPDPLLRADLDRNGVLDAADDRATPAQRAQGALVLANLDDDTERCSSTDSDGAPLGDVDLAACHDAADEIVNGDADLADLATVEVLPRRGLDASATGVISLGAGQQDRARVFVQRGAGAAGMEVLGSGDALTAEELGEGVELAVEMRDIVRDRSVWDGAVDLTLTVTEGPSSHQETVRFRVAPLLLVHDLLPLQQVIVADNQSPVVPPPPGLRTLRAEPELNIVGEPMPAAPDDTTFSSNRTAVVERDWRPGEQEFRADLVAGLASAGIEAPLLELPSGGDRWMQDVMEPGYMSVPSAEGEHRMQVFIRSANRSRSGGAEGRPLREAGRVVFTHLRGPDVAGIQQYDPDRFAPGGRTPYDTFNSGGNFGATPPYSLAGTSYPTGRMVYGARGRFAPDATFLQMLHAQGEQDPVVLDTSWLTVGHIDEFLTFFPADNARGWVIGVADVDLGQELLQQLVEDGRGDEPVVNDVAREQIPGLTVAGALRDRRTRFGYHYASRGLDRAVDVLTRELGLAEDEIVRLPALLQDRRQGRSGERPATVAFLPGVANGIQTGASTYLAPTQHGPQDAAGVDVFAAETERRLAEIGMDVAWVEDWEYAHLGSGEIHCVTNTVRDLSQTAAWWQD